MKIAVGDLGEFVYRDYKEPFEQLEGGYPGHPRGALLADEANGKLLCALCGKRYELLGRHVASHGLSAREYRREVGLRSDTALASDRVRITNHRTAVTNPRGSAAMAAHARGMAWSHRVAELNKTRPQGPSSGVGRWNPEHLNRHGRCYEQVLAVARELAMAGRLSQVALSRKGIGSATVDGWFGSFEALRIRLKAPVPPTRNHGLSDDDLLNGLRRLAGLLGRTPYNTDLKRYGLPAPNTYTRRFGSWANACTAAGLMPNPSAGIQPDLAEEIALLTAYAAVGAYNKVVSQMHHDDAWARRVFAKYGWPYPPGYRGPGRREWAAELAQRLSAEQAA